ncbi:diguanylate cyclase [bacterium]|nr:diguanylate cyclase [bacterium]
MSNMSDNNENIEVIEPIENKDDFRLVQLSVPVKIVLFTGIIYVVVMALASVFFTFVSSKGIDGLLGLSITIWSGAGQAVLIGVLVAISSHIFLNKPLKTLAEEISKVHEEDYSINAPKLGNDEIGDLAKSFNKMLSKITHLSASHSEATQDLEIAKRELCLKESLEEKTKIIEKTNMRLSDHVKDLQMLYEIGQALNAIIDLDSLHKVIVDVLEKRLESQEFALLMLDDNEQTLAVTAAYGFRDVERVKKVVMRLGEGISGKVAAKGEAVYIRDMKVEGGFVPYLGSVGHTGSVLCLPLKHQDKVLGVITFGRIDLDAFSDSDIQVLTMVANQIALAVENAKLYTKTCQLSLTDELTGLYNRRHMQSVLQIEWKRATRFKRSISVLMIDIDHFKKFNDHYGHVAGDKVLRKISMLLKSHVREVDNMSRFGGEEFVAILPDTDKTGAMAVAEKLRKLVLRQNFGVDATDIPSVTISVGVASYPDDALEQDDLIDHADIALYEAKDTGRNCVIAYPDSLQPSSYYEKRESKKKNSFV